MTRPTIQNGEFLVFDEVGSPDWLDATPTRGSSSTSLDDLRDCKVLRLQDQMEAAHRHMQIHGHSIEVVEDTSGRTVIYSHPAIHNSERRAAKAKDRKDTSR